MQRGCDVSLMCVLGVKAMGFQDIMKGASIDAKIFTPCGFSLNALFEVGGLWGFLVWN